MDEAWACLCVGDCRDLIQSHLYLVLVLHMFYCLNSARETLGLH